MSVVDSSDPSSVVGGGGIPVTSGSPEPGSASVVVGTGSDVVSPDPSSTSVVA